MDCNRLLLEALEKRIAELESTAERGEQFPHPAYKVAAEWKAKAEAADHNRNEIMKATQCRRFSESDCQCAKCYRDKELSELRETIVVANRFVEEQRKRADANQAAADTLERLRAEGWFEPQRKLQAERDAERGRWLMNNSCWIGSIDSDRQQVYAVLVPTPDGTDGGIDEQVDEAIAAEKSPTPSSCGDCGVCIVCQRKEAKT